jgi:hydrophobic/amphiphilic exporter-1 (mainly G- bacteria), HAE1 family
MNLSQPFIQRPVMTTLLMIAIVFMGMLSYDQLPISDLPDVDYPVITVSVKFPGASAETMANSVALPLEKEFLTINGIKDVTSTNGSNLTNIVLQFDISKDLDSAAVDVQAAIMRAKKNLPPDLPNDPTYMKVNPAVVPFFYLVLTSETVSLADLYTYANIYISQRLSMINGVALVEVHGYPYAVRIQVNPQKLANLGLTLTDVSTAVQKGNVNIPTGELVGQNFAQTITVNGQLRTAELYDPLIVTYKNQSPLRIQDIGRAINSLQQYRHEMLYIKDKSRRPSVIIAVQKQIGANTVRLSDAIRERLPSLKSQLPSAIEMISMFDKAEPIKESVDEGLFTLIMAFILVTFVIFFYLGKVRDTIIPSFILPMSILATFIVMHLLGYSIDNLSILAFILAMGFIIDDAIVVLENIVRHVEAGESPAAASLKGSQQIGFTILSMTISLVAVFIPILFMGGLIGSIFREFAIVLITITIISGIISLSLTPMLCSLFIKAPKKNEKKGRLELFSQKLNSRMLNAYTPILNWVLDHRWVALAMSALTVILSGYLFVVLPKDFIANDDIGFIIAYMQGQEGVSPQSMINHVHKINDILEDDPNIEQFVSIAAYPQYRNGVAYLRLKPRKDRKPIQEIIQDLYGKMNRVPGINSFLKNIPSIDFTLGQESKGNYQYSLESLTPEELYPTTDKMINKMYTLPGFQGISSDLEIQTPQIHVNILRDQASALGVSAEAIEIAFKLAYSGEKISRIETEKDHYDVILELEPAFQQNLKALSSIYVRSDTTNQLVPLSAVAEWKEKIGPASISHIAQFPATTISFNLKPGIPVGIAIDSLKKAAEETLPPSVTGTLKGTAETFAESFKNIFILMILAILVIYIVLGILYESFIHPITILSTLPPAAFGGLATLLILGLPFSFYAALGIFMLIGIVKKNGIMMIDYAIENIRTQKLTPREAIFEACTVRFRPIMMTTVAAVMGAVPIILATGMGAEARHPLGYVVIGGLLFSQLITLFVTPAIYLYMEEFSQWLEAPNKENEV